MCRRSNAEDEPVPSVRIPVPDILLYPFGKCNTDSSVSPALFHNHLTYSHDKSLLINRGFPPLLIRIIWILVWFYFSEKLVYSDVSVFRCGCHFFQIAAFSCKNNWLNCSGKALFNGRAIGAILTYITPVEAIGAN